MKFYALFIWHNERILIIQQSLKMHFFSYLNRGLGEPHCYWSITTTPENWKRTYPRQWSKLRRFDIFSKQIVKKLNINWIVDLKSYILTMFSINLFDHNILLFDQQEMSCQSLTFQIRTTVTPTDLNKNTSIV